MFFTYSLLICASSVLRRAVWLSAGTTLGALRDCRAVTACSSWLFSGSYAGELSKGCLDLAGCMGVAAL